VNVHERLGIAYEVRHQVLSKAIVHPVEKRQSGNGGGFSLNIATPEWLVPSTLDSGAV
jgi:hypothetical protein